MTAECWNMPLNQDLAIKHHLPPQGHLIWSGAGELHFIYLENTPPSHFLSLSIWPSFPIFPLYALSGLHSKLPCFSYWCDVGILTRLGVNIDQTWGQVISHLFCLPGSTDFSRSREQEAERRSMSDSERGFLSRRINHRCLPRSHPSYLFDRISI